jgi:flavin reductase (DIM6/NTAB) family NADH-FMN oxidoreductase RutF
MPERRATPPGAPPTAPTAAQLRRAASRYATGVAIVTTWVDGVDHAMTANSFTTVSLDPLLALVCVERDSRFHEAVLAAGSWAVSFLAEGGEATARWFATRGRPLAGQFDAVATRRGTNDCLLLADALAGLELRTVQVVPAGDHDIVLGEVTAVHEPTDGAEEPARPTVYFASRFHDLR